MQSKAANCVRLFPICCLILQEGAIKQNINQTDCAEEVLLIQDTCILCEWA